MTTTHTPVGKRLVRAGNARGLTLPELTLTIAVILGLIGLLFTGTTIYAAHANRSSCLMAQDQLRKAIVADANLKNRKFRPGVDYYADAVARGIIDVGLTCPESGGVYTATVDEEGGELIIRCSELGDDHRH